MGKIILNIYVFCIYREINFYGLARKFLIYPFCRSYFRGIIALWKVIPLPILYIIKVRFIRINSIFLSTYYICKVSYSSFNGLISNIFWLIFIFNYINIIAFNSNFSSLFIKPTSLNSSDIEIKFIDIISIGSIK